MSILILSRFPEHLFNYKEWLNGYKGQIFIFCPEKFVKSYIESGYDLVKGFENYAENNQIEIEALTLYESNKFDKVLTLDESDLIRAARIREKLKISGQSSKSAEAYRNKALMKKILSHNGINCAPFKKIDNIFEIYDFVKIHNFPIVIKPIYGMGSIGTLIINNITELVSATETLKFENLIIEKFIKGKMYTVDGIMENREIKFVSTSEYFTGTCATFTSDNYLSINLLNLDSEISKKLIDLCKKVIKILPAVEISTFHCEIFQNEDGELVLCEIASRTSGGRLDECIAETYGININREWFRKAINLKSIEKPKEDNDNLLGVILINKKKGKIKKIPLNLPFNFIHNVSFRFKEGDVLNTSIAAGDSFGTIMFKGKSHSELRDNCISIEEYLNENLIIEELTTNE